MGEVPHCASALRQPSGNYIYLKFIVKVKCRFITFGGITWDRFCLPSQYRELVKQLTVCFHDIHKVIFYGIQRALEFSYRALIVFTEGDPEARTIILRDLQSTREKLNV